MVENQWSNPQIEDGGNAMFRAICQFAQFQNCAVQNTNLRIAAQIVDYLPVDQVTTAFHERGELK